MNRVSNNRFLEFGILIKLSGDTMKIRMRLAKFIWWPLLLGLPMAFVAGVFDVQARIQEHAYLPYHLYYTTVRLLASAIDRWAPGIVGFLFLLGVFAWLGSRIKGVGGRVSRVVFPLLLLLSVTGYYLWLHRYEINLHDMGNTTLSAVCAMLFGPFGLGVLLVVLVSVGVRIRLKRLHPETTCSAKGPTSESSSRTPRLSWQIAQKLLSGVVLGVLFLLTLAFLLVNLTAGLFQLHRNNLLRSQPNIIFIMVDTLRADHVGCYGYDLPTTPNIDRFALESTRFEHAIAQSSWTVWSVHSIMTSYYPEYIMTDHPGTGQLQPTMAPRNCYTTLPEVLSDQGYSTNAVISNPLLNRFSDASVQGYDYYQDNPAQLDTDCRQTSPEVTREALKRLAAIKRRKFFLSLVYMDPHAPYHQNQGFEFGASRMDEQRRRMLSSTNSLEKMKERQHALPRYDSEIGYTDHYVGEFLEALKRQGLYDNSLIVLFSDHGEEFLEHGDFHHTKTVYNEVITVPLIIKYPHQRRGTVIRGTFPLIDLYPSLLSYLGIGSSGLKLQGDTVNLDSLLSCSEKPIYSATVFGVQSVRNGSHKYISTSTEKYQRDRQTGKALKYREWRQEMFDLAADPVEQHNIFQQSPADAGVLTALLHEHQTTLLAPEMQPAHRSLFSFRKSSAGKKIDQQFIERLKSLGYLNPGSSSHPNSASPRQ